MYILIPEMLKFEKIVMMAADFESTHSLCTLWENIKLAKEQTELYIIQHFSGTETEDIMTAKSPVGWEISPVPFGLPLPSHHGPLGTG